MRDYPSDRVDLRSDTVTQPTAAMREAMKVAEVGDDVFGDDPTVQKLERRVADLLGKEAGVFVPSGTMANQAAIRAHSDPGDEIFTHRQSHIYLYESGAWAAISGCSIRLLDGEGGLFDAEDVDAAFPGCGSSGAPSPTPSRTTAGGVPPPGPTYPRFKE